MKHHWSSPDAHGRRRRNVCRGNGYRFGKLRAAETCVVRKVADAAAAFDRDGSKHRELVDALKESGR